MENKSNKTARTLHFHFSPEGIKKMAEETGSNISVMKSANASTDSSAQSSAKPSLDDDNIVDNTSLNELFSPDKGKKERVRKTTTLALENYLVLTKGKGERNRKSHRSRREKHFPPQRRRRRLRERREESSRIQSNQRRSRKCPSSILKNQR